MWEREWSNWIRQKILSWKAKDFERKPLVCTPSPGSARLAPITNVDAQCRASQSSSVEKCERICFGLIWLLVPGCLHLPHPPFYNKSNLLNVFLTESLSTKNRHYGMMQVPLCNKSNLNVFMTEKKTWGCKTALHNSILVMVMIFCCSCPRYLSAYALERKDMLSWSLCSICCLQLLYHPGVRSQDLNIYESIGYFTIIGAHQNCKNT